MGGGSGRFEDVTPLALKTGRGRGQGCLSQKGRGTMHPRTPRGAPPSPAPDPCLTGEMPVIPLPCRNSW